MELSVVQRIGPPPYPDLSPVRLAALRRRRTAELHELIRHGVVRPAHADSLVADEVLLAYLLNCYEIVKADILRELSHTSPAEWLFHLRRVPQSMWQAASDLGESLFPRHLAETLTGMAERKALMFVRHEPGYPVDRSASNRVMALAASVNFLAHIEWLIRQNSRHVRFAFQGRDEIPTPQPTKGQAAATARYFRRLEGTERFLHRAGTRLGTLRQFSVNDLACIVAMPVRAHGRVDGWNVDGKHVVTDTLVQYQIEAVSFERLDTFLLSAGDLLMNWPDTRFTAVATLLTYCSVIARQLPTWSSLWAFGYISIDYDWFQERFADHIDEIIGVLPSAIRQRAPRTISELELVLKSLRPEVRPLRPGPILRVDGNLLLVDVYAASYWLDSLLDYSADTEALAKIRASDFENVVQGAIDSSRWAPNDDLRRLWKRVLKRGQRDITDVDAVGANGTHLLIVSVKSRVFTEAFDRGDFVVVRNAATMVTEACRDASRVSVELRAHPVGDNYDLAAFNRILVPVCMPYPVWAPEGETTIEIFPGLMAAVSLTELSQFLARP